MNTTPRSRRGHNIGSRIRQSLAGLTTAVMLAAITASSALAAPPPTPAPGIDWNSRSSIPVVINVGNLLIGIVTTLALAFFGALLILGLFKWARNKDEGRNMAGVSLLAIVLIGGFGGFMGAFTSLGALLHF